MARRLIHAGHDVSVWNRTRARADSFSSEGARVADTPADTARDAEVAITMLATPGASMKLVANSTIGAAISAVGEALALSDAVGLRREQVLEILSDSPVGSTVRSKRRLIETRSYPANFKLRHAAKDMRLVNEEAERDGVELEVAEASKAWLERAEAEGHGDEDYSAVVETIAERPSNDA